MSALLLPLFPLDTVLLPGAPLPLHVFEPRYKEMVGECLDQNRPFGILRAKEEELAQTGCTAEILAVTKKYDDGRMDIVTQGRECFEVVRLNHDRAFLQGEVVYLHDEGGVVTAQQVEQAMHLHGEILKLAGAEPEKASEIDEGRLSFYLAGSLPLDLDFKQTLLETRSEPERLQALISFFETILPSIRRTVQARRKAGGNGHAS